MMAVWRRKPDSEVIVHSDQGSQYGSDDWQRFCRANNLAPGMSRRGNCWDNAVGESFFSSLKKERIRKRIYKTRDLAGRISSITLKCSTIGPGATVTSAASVRRPLNRPRREDRICLRAWGQSILAMYNVVSPPSVRQKPDGFFFCHFLPSRSSLLEGI